MKILTYGDPQLRRTAVPVQRIDHELILAAQEMIETMVLAEGLGLAATQVGIHVRMVALGLPELQSDPDRSLSPGEAMLLPLMPLVLVNPVIVSAEGCLVLREEGCLSVPEIYAPVERQSIVYLQARILGGDPILVECSGLLARAIQHEIDHLDGKLFVDRLRSEDIELIRGRLDRIKGKRPIRSTDV
jgi:peptide deformylase